MPSRKRRSVSVLAAIAIASTGFFTSLALGAAEPCASGIDVRNLEEVNIPASLKEQILKAPGKIINTASSIYPSGKVVVLRTALQGTPVNSAVTTAYIDQIFFGTVQGEKSMEGYFSQNSYSAFKVTKGAIPSWITLSKKISDYAPGIEGNSLFVTNVLQKASVNWTSMDTNSDGVISRREAQIVILVPNATSASGYASTRFVNAGRVVTPQGTFTFSDRPVITFSLKALTEPDYNINPIRSLPTVAHELGHSFFNLTDRYGSSSGTGGYDMMGAPGSSKWVHLTMFDKMKIGWIQPKIVREHLGQCLQFVASAIQKAALVVVPTDSFLATPLEYWVIENRNKLYADGGYDDDLPDEGLAIWYVSVGTYSSGHDDVRLVNFSKPDQDPDLYKNPGPDALFTVDPSNPRRVLLDRKGQWNLLWFQNVSDAKGGVSPGLFMYAEF